MNSVFLLLSVLFIVTPSIYGQASSTSFSSSCNTWTKYTSFINTLTTLVPSSSNQRCVHSSGGAAGGIVSEGQGYGLLTSATILASLPTTDPNYATALNYAYQFFKGWKAMCILSTSSSNCQSTPMCLDTTSNTYYPCLPHWKFDDSLNNPQTGSATDGDVDGITGCCLLASATASNKPAYWNEVANWCYGSIKAYYAYDVEQDTVSGNPEAVIKLGSCWGGISCTNPSYFAPGQYRFFIWWAQTFGAAFASSSTEVTTIVANYQKAISTTYKIISSAQNSAGLVPNWYIPNSNDLSQPGPTSQSSCDGSGTPYNQYGAEAGRIVWRVAFDYIMYGNANAKTFLDKIAKELVSKYSSNSFGNLDTGGFVASIFANWQTTAYMYGPTFCALVDNLGLANQAAALTTASNIVCSGTISDYYGGCWDLISTITLSGDLAKSAGFCGGTPPGPVAPVAPVAPVPVPVNPTPVPVPVTPTPVPVPVPVVPSPPSANTCTLKGCAINLYYAEFVVTGTVSSTSMLCSGGSVRTISCSAVSGTTGKYSCQDGSACISPVPIVNGAHCPYSIPKSSSTCAQGNSNNWWIEFFPPSTAASSPSANLAAVLCQNGAFQGNAVASGGKFQISIKSTECDNPVPIYDGSFCLYPGTTYSIPAVTSLVSDASTSSDPNMVSLPVWGIGLMIAGCVAIVIALIIVVAVIKRKRSTEEIV